MARLGGESGFVARFDDHVLRLVGVAFVCWSGAVTAASVTTDYGLAVSRDATAASATADLGTVGAVATFALAHPAYPALLFLGLVLVALGDETPLLS